MTMNTRGPGIGRAPARGAMVEEAPKRSPTPKAPGCDPKLRVPPEHLRREGCVLAGVRAATAADRRRRRRESQSARTAPTGCGGADIRGAPAQSGTGPFVARKALPA